MRSELEQFGGDWSVRVGVGHGELDHSIATEFPSLAPVAGCERAYSLPVVNRIFVLQRHNWWTARTAWRNLKLTESQANQTARQSNWQLNRRATEPQTVNIETAGRMCGFRKAVENKVSRIWNPEGFFMQNFLQNSSKFSWKITQVSLPTIWKKDFEEIGFQSECSLFRMKKQKVGEHCSEQCSWRTVHLELQLNWTNLLVKRFTWL